MATAARQASVQFDSLSQSFKGVGREWYRHKTAKPGDAVQLDNESRSVVSIVRIEQRRCGDTVYVVSGIDREYRGSPCTLFVPVTACFDPSA